MFKVDQLLFSAVNLDVPIFCPTFAKKQGDHSSATWNSLKRIIALCNMKESKFKMPGSKKLKPSKHVVLKVPDQSFSYSVMIGKGMPMFTCVPQSDEIIKRLVIKGAHTKDISELDLDLSQPSND